MEFDTLAVLRCLFADSCYIGLGSEDEVRLIDTLFNTHGYNPLIRPVLNMSEVVTIKFGLAMIQLINVVSICSITISWRRGSMVRTLVFNFP